MASPASAVVASLLERLRPRALDCRVCLREVTAATTALLPCCHAFHRACLAQQAEAHRGQTLRCGVCGTEAAGVKTAEDVEKLPADLLAEVALAGKAHCRVCEEEGDGEVDAVAQCTTCAKALCDGHRSLHTTKKMYAEHTVEALVVSRGTPRCPAHPARPLEMYCTLCEAVCCSLCIVAAHPSPEHQTFVLAAHAPELRKRLDRASTVGTQCSEELAQRLAGLRASLADVDVHTAKLEDAVNRTMDVLAQRMAIRREEVLRELKVLAADERAALEAEYGEDQRRWLALEGALRTANELTPESCVDHLGQLAAPTAAHLTKAARDVVQHAPPAALIEFVVSDDVVSVLAGLGQFVYRRAYGPECVGGEPDTTCVGVNKKGRFTVTAWTRSKERVTTGGDHVKARLVCVANGNVSECTVDDAGDGTYVVSFTARDAGEYQLDVGLNGRALRASPFAVKVCAMGIFTGPPYYDNNGVIYHLATAGGTRPWTNPHDAGVVKVSFSSDGNGALATFVDNKVPTRESSCTTNNCENSWMSVSLKGKRVIPSGYVVSTDASGLNGFFLLRTWHFQGSVNGVAWTTLQSKSYDDTLTPEHPTGFWPVDAAWTNYAFTRFRILQTGSNWSNSDRPNARFNYCLAITSFEIYGKLLDL